MELLDLNGALAAGMFFGAKLFGAVFVARVIFRLVQDW